MVSWDNCHTGKAEVPRVCAGQGLAIGEMKEDAPGGRTWETASAGGGQSQLVGSGAEHEGLAGDSP